MFTYTMKQRLMAEAIGTFVLVLGGCGSAIFALSFGNVGLGILGVGLAFGLTLTVMAAAIGPVSGCHINPAVTVGMYLAKRFPRNEIGPYIAAQLVGAIVASTVIYIIAVGAPNFTTLGGFAANGYGRHSPGQYSWFSALVTELVLSAIFVFVVLCATDQRASKSAAPFAVGFALALVNIVGIVVTNCSVNPARSTGPAIFAGGWALGQLWLFWVAPLAGAAIAAVTYRQFEEKVIEPPITRELPEKERQIRPRPTGPIEPRPN